MSDYKESLVSGTVWQRCHTVRVNNTYQEQPFIEFLEEKIVVLDGNTYIRQGVQGLCEKHFSPTDIFPIIDPTTNTLTGQTMTHAEFYTVLYSLYMQTAMERDSQLGT